MALDEEAIRKKITVTEKPWGNFKQYAHNELCTVKVLTVAANQVLSKQRHKNRDELWIIMDDGLKVELDDRVLHPEPGEEIVIMRKVMHRLSSLGKRGRVVEISFGEFDEEDIERFDDIYGRV